MSGVLEGVKVLDFGRYIAGPFCGALLADYGAEVIRIERVNGSEDRYVTPVSEDGQGAPCPSSLTGVTYLSSLPLTLSILITSAP